MRRALLGMLIMLIGAPALVRAQPFESPEPPLVGAPPMAPGVVAPPLGERGEGLPGFLAPPVEPADPPSPAVSIHVRAPANAAVGQEADYRILVENASRAPAHHVRVRTAVPAGATFVRASPEPTARDPEIIWQLETLPAGASKELLLTLKPTGGDLDVTARVQFEHGESVHTQVGGSPAAPPATPPTATPISTPPVAPTSAPPQQAALRLRIAGPQQAAPQDVVSLQLVAANAGTAEADAVELEISLPDGLVLWSRTEQAPKGNRAAWKVGRLAPGATAVRDCDVLVAKVGDQDAVAQATAAGGLRETASWTVRVDEPKLNVTIAGPEKRLLNRPAKYQITVTNQGRTPLAGVEVRADVPPGFQLTGASNNGRMEQNQVHWLLGDAPAGQQATLTVELTAAHEGDATVHVTARAGRGITGNAEAKTHFEGAAGLRVDIDKDQDPLTIGNIVTYTIHIHNRGSAAARNLQLTATMPPQMQPAAPNDPNGPTQLGQKLTFPALAALEAGKETTYTIRLRAVQAGQVKVVVELQSAELTPPLHEEETTTIVGDAAPAAEGPPPPNLAPPTGPPAPPGPPPLPGPG
ncbi:MAG TPA: hypothetical protein VMS17_28940 [Gemmataceae bacterium]|nr:hypothetical protein [Gemmataceae bacterium]